MQPVTNAENIRRGRNVKLDWEQVSEIRAGLDSGVPRKALAAHYGVSLALIHHIATKRAWNPDI
jgi:hypothetical protein